ncbi:prolactin receptor a [Pseudochaenichthys georgianus]|uniref:prolactin receptor a n=1 Tax=Pseudochaenichthys georgianus TaxID=52239 RepID=UPI00146D40B2|nr:prolactin receptor a [Pseudochaenichthys georgianus]
MGCGAMMKSVMEVLLLLMLFFTAHAKEKSYSPPEKTKQTRCRSPEKETFTCWWEPGSDGGLPTTYALYYRKENSETVYECPDYHTAGENSCFFNKNDTSIWVNYNISVVATNALGRAFSDPVDIDVVYIVEPNPPEKLTVAVMEDKGWPFLLVSWEPPHKADTRSGWITLIYELRVRLEEEEDDWEMHHAGQQKMFNIFSLRSGGEYLVEVRCKPDHGFWSEWSSTSYVKVPDYFHREKSMWILVAVFSALIFLILTWLLHMNSHSLKHCILPPVPGPKIKGFDNKLLKNGNSDEIFSALVVPNFPPASASKYEEMLVEYLEVYVPEEPELMLEESKDLLDSCLKSENSRSDSDSGRGSCNSHTLLMDKCGETKEEERQTNRESSLMETQGWKEEAINHDTSGKVKTWPSVYSPLPQYGSNPLDKQSSLETAKQHSLSTSFFLIQPGTKDALGPSYTDFCLSNKENHLHPQTLAHRALQTRSDVNISNIGCKRSPATEYVEVQRINKEDMVLLQPVVSRCGHIEGCPNLPKGEDYSKLKGVDCDNRLLLQREGTREDVCPCVDQETNREGGNCYTSSTVSTTQKPTACMYTAMPLQEETALTLNGYVDTATMGNLPSC